MPAHTDALTSTVELMGSTCHLFLAISRREHRSSLIDFLLSFSCDMSVSEQSSRRPRSRNVKRTFVLLREDDITRVPNSATIRSLEQSGRVKELEFTNNASSEHISELLMNAFGNFLNNSNLNR